MARSQWSTAKIVAAAVVVGLRINLAAATTEATAAEPEAKVRVNAGEAASKGCTLTVAECRNFPEYRRKQFRDSVGEQHLKANSNDAACLKRAEDLHHWCGNGLESGPQVGATFSPAPVSQVYHPGACERGWSQWDAFCYKHFWESRTWWEAEALCRQQDGHLCSIHSHAENRFVATLTLGLSSWIGYQDLDQDTHYKWSDNTQDDFSNWAKNCTGREHEPDCQPEETRQQWHGPWDGNDRGTFVCKQNARLPMGLLVNVTAEDLASKAWEDLMPALAVGLGVSETKAACNATALPTLQQKTPELLDLIGPDSKGKEPALPEPKLGLPSMFGSLL